MKLTPRIIASRANGRLSRGPKTEEGKKRSSMNPLRHGLLSRCVVMPDESRDLFNALLEQYQSKFNPLDDVDQNHVEEMATAVWKMRRLWAVETDLWSKAAASRPEDDPIGRISGAFSDLARQPELYLLFRYEGRFQRMYQHALENLLVCGAITSECQTNLDSDNPPAINGVDAGSSDPK